MVPKLSRAAVLWYAGSRDAERSMQETETAASKLGVHVRSFPVRSLSEIDGAFNAMTEWSTGALVVVPSSVLWDDRTNIMRFASKHQLFSICPEREYVEAGGLIAYGASLRDQFRRAAVYVDKILKGTKPADLPVEQPTKFELVINLKTAKALGLEVPPTLLARADEVIE
jgi:putative ABC transport system substrate-binding protein